MDRDTLASARCWLADRCAAVVVEVTQALGSAPRTAGTRMLVAADRSVGTIGGGHLEQVAIDRARALLAADALPVVDGSKAAPLHVDHLPLGPALGQCCGGAVTLAYRRLDAEALARWPEPEPRFHLQLYGAGHVGRAIATLLATLDVSVDWIDEREAEFPATTAFGTPWPARIRQVCVDTVEAEVRDAPPGACYLVLTHEHALDLRIAEAILRRGDFRYFGLIGSRTKRQRFLHRFAHRGVPGEAVARMTCPIGVEGIAGKQPELIAVAVLAQLLQRTDPAEAAKPAVPATTARPARRASATTP